MQELMRLTAVLLKPQYKMLMALAYKLSNFRFSVIWIGVKGTVPVGSSRVKLMGNVCPQGLLFVISDGRYVASGLIISVLDNNHVCSNIDICIMAHFYISSHT